MGLIDQSPVARHGHARPRSASRISRCSVTSLSWFDVSPGAFRLASSDATGIVVRNACTACSQSRLSNTFSTRVCVLKRGTWMSVLHVRPRVLFPVAFLGMLLVPTLLVTQERQTGGPGLTVFRDVNFRGRSATFRDDISNLQSVGLNDQVSSLRVGANELWEVCEHSEFRGRCRVVSGSEADLRRGSWNNMISSARRVSGSGRPRPRWYRPARRAGTARVVRQPAVSGALVQCRHRDGNVVRRCQPSGKPARDRPRLADLRPSEVCRAMRDGVPGCRRPQGHRDGQSSGFGATASLAAPVSHEHHGQYPPKSVSLPVAARGPVGPRVDEPARVISVKGR